MGRFEDTEAAVAERLRAMKATPEVTINLFDLGVPLASAGYSEEEVMGVLDALEQDRMIEILPGNRFRLLKPLPTI